MREVISRLQVTIQLIMSPDGTVPDGIHWEAESGDHILMTSNVIKMETCMQQVILDLPEV